MLWGQKLKVYTDHKNLEKDGLGTASDRVYRWRLLLEEFAPEIVYIKGIHNSVADPISRLDYTPSENVAHHAAFMQLLADDYDADVKSHVDWLAFSHFHNSCEIDQEVGGTTEERHSFVTSCFASRGKEEQEEIFPLTIPEIVDAQLSDKDLCRYFEDGGASSTDRYEIAVIEDQRVVTEKGKIVIPKSLQTRTVMWYHHYLQHPGSTRLEETLRATMTWDGLRKTVRRHTETCHSCQKGKRSKYKYGKLPTKIAWTRPWKTLCVDLVGPYTLNGKDGTEVDFMCMTMIDPATSWFEIVEIPVV